MSPDSITTVCFSKESRICACSIADTLDTGTAFPSHPVAPRCKSSCSFFSRFCLWIKPTDAFHVWFIYVDSFSRLAGLTILPADTSRSRSLMLDLEMAWATKGCRDNGKICTRLSISTTSPPSSPTPFIVLFTFFPFDCTHHRRSWCMASMVT